MIGGGLRHSGGLELEYVIGVLLALAVAGGIGAGTGFDRDRSFTPVVLIVIASITFYSRLSEVPNGRWYLKASSRWASCLLRSSGLNGTCGCGRRGLCRPWTI